MKVDEIKTIVQLMAENDLTEFKIESEGYNLCIKRGNTAVPATVAVPAPAVAAADRKSTRLNSSHAT